MADVLLETRDGWIELIEYLAQQSPLEERHVSEAMTLFAVPFQGQAWQRVHGLWVASGRRWDNPGEGWSREVERFVVDLLHVIAPPQTSSTGGSPTTAGEGAAGSGGSGPTTAGEWPCPQCGQPTERLYGTGGTGHAGTPLRCGACAGVSDA